MKADGQPFVPRCAETGCRSFGSYGYGCDLLKVPARLGTWYCRAHWPDAPERLSSAESAPSTPPPPLPAAPAPRGRLL